VKVSLTLDGSEIIPKGVETGVMMGSRELGYDMAESFLCKCTIQRNRKEYSVGLSLSPVQHDFKCTTRCLLLFDQIM